ncbi:hypothetical protein ATCV1_z132L [Acanthocystis turfacea chlorella virus 1]|uniref:Uncharacterized protein z132L n=1 Tax=Chlorovirus heliozoae TaxID=322019 RepID=A7K892_9PHYC|nr:hypothetical protein ATCV1_z132L [Acanthocystis turfacea chlorella virus 1]ABT16266.1 hypothetical protein ATCV1_z132L [Acanthocystis turfacea chlorella virus 1]
MYITKWQSPRKPSSWKTTQARPSVLSLVLPPAWPQRRPQPRATPTSSCARPASMTRSGSTRAPLSSWRPPRP